MIAEGTIYQCKNCNTEVEILAAGQPIGPLVCCETAMNKAKDFDQLWEEEAYDISDLEWN